MMPTLIKYRPNWALQASTFCFKTADNVSLYYKMGINKGKVHIGEFMRNSLCGVNLGWQGQFTTSSETREYMQSYRSEMYCKKCLKKCTITNETTSKLLIDIIK